MPESPLPPGPRAVLIDDPTVFHQAIDPDNLDQAWGKVLGNGGAAGGDGMTLRRFQPGAPRHLATLRHNLLSGRYHPGPIRRVQIPKRDGSPRTLTIPCVIDRIAQTALLQVLAPLIDAEFQDTSFAYRTGRGVQQAVERVRGLHAAGHVWLVDADIDDYFDNVPHDRLMARLAETMTDGPATQLIALWLEHAATGGRGLAQGSPISPLLANLYLDRLDEAFASRDARIVRFADDFVILAATRAGADAAHTRVRGLLAEHGLALNTDKSRVTSFDQGFRFLGHLFVRSLILPGQPDEPTDATAALIRRLAEADDRAEDAEREREEREETRLRSGLDVGQRVLYVTSPDRRLAIRNQAFSVQAGVSNPDRSVDWHEVLAIHHTEVDRIELGPEVGAIMAAQRLALASDTPIAFVNGHGETQGWLAPRFGPRAGRHLAQAAVALDQERRLALARLFVEGRLRNQRALLRRLSRDGSDPAVVKALAGLNGMIRAIGRPASLAALLGHEGQATALYWPAFGRLLAGDLRLRVRRREGPEDEVNILLNITASLLARDVTVALERAGLHPGFGVLHGTADGHDGAVYDLMEEFRAPLAESAVARLLARKAVTAADFRKTAARQVRLNTDGYAAVVRMYESAVRQEVRSQRDGRRRSWRGIMLDQALALAAHVEGRGDYAPYVIDY